jgi:hypothetical protein
VALLTFYDPGTNEKCKQIDPKSTLKWPKMAKNGPIAIAQKSFCIKISRILDKKLPIKWTKSRPKIYLKWTKNGPKMDQKYVFLVNEMRQNWSNWRLMYFFARSLISGHFLASARIMQNFARLHAKNWAPKFIPKMSR